MNQYVLSLQAPLCHLRFGDVQLEMPSGYDHYEFTVMRNVAVCSHFRTVPPVLFIRPHLQNISSSPFWQNNAHRNISRAGPPSRTSFDSTELKYRTAPPRLVNTVRTRLDNFRAFLNSLEVFFICFVFRRKCADLFRQVSSGLPRMFISDQPQRNKKTISLPLV